MTEVAPWRHCQCCKIRLVLSDFFLLNFLIFKFFLNLLMHHLEHRRHLRRAPQVARAPLFADAWFKDYNKGMKYLGDYFNQVERTDLLNYQLNGSQLAKMEKSIPHMSLPWNSFGRSSWSKKFQLYLKNYDFCEYVKFAAGSFCMPGKCMLHAGMLGILTLK